ncbi:sce7725 family protein [Dongia sedimenti]|uniref:Sce7725 family protein n=1 Tax=Dongia sedimenti TaxID=3064282 RepID=A0ABU0YKA6_9PROT|nr:sce7725 family protein [Rhodospirillaceae bacterium R-7]
MYHPYFRGKQFELITIRETASILAESGFVPIIEPVRESLGGLEKTLRAICDARGKAVVIVNPYHGDHREDGVDITELLRDGFADREDIGVGILLRADMSANDAVALYRRHQAHPISFVHAGFSQARALSEALGTSPVARQVFVEAYCNRLYRRHFAVGERILVRDGFKRQRNRDYPLVELFSDLHITYREEGMDGFGDFLIVGDDYSETGGPAYAVAIHLTYIDPDQDDAMFIYHFVSDRQDTPTDPAGKFAEALAKLIRKWNTGNSKLLETSAIGEFLDLHAKGHFPGLGYLKKLSMKHHIETLADFDFLE